MHSVGFLGFWTEYSAFYQVVTALRPLLVATSIKQRLSETIRTTCDVRTREIFAEAPAAQISMPKLFDNTSLAKQPRRLPCRARLEPCRFTGVAFSERAAHEISREYADLSCIGVSRPSGQNPNLPRPRDAKKRSIHPASLSNPKVPKCERAFQASTMPGHGPWSMYLLTCLQHTTKPRSWK